MTGLTVLLALLPVILILLLLVVRRMAADLSGLAGWVAAIVVAMVFFQTPFAVTLRASLAGMVASLPITLMVAASIFQITIMLETGAVKRVMTVVKTVSPEDQVVQIMIINIGVGTILAAMGATPVSILPPIMLALGYSPLVAIALPAIGYDALCTYALLSEPLNVFSRFVGRPPQEVGMYFARYMPVISTCIAFGMLWIVGKWPMIRKGWLPTVLAGTSAGFIAIGMNMLNLIPITGLAAGLGVILVMAAYLKLRGKPFIDRSVLTPEDLETERGMSLFSATSPWLFLVVLCVLVNVPAFKIGPWLTEHFPMALSIIPKDRPMELDMFKRAYFLVLLSTIIALPFLRPSSSQLRTSASKWLKRAPRPALAAAVFFAIAFILNHSGKNSDYVLVDATKNMVQVIAVACAGLFQKAYPVVAPFLGLMGGFISGSEASAIAMLTKLHMNTAEKIGASGLVLAAASGIGGGLASVISPAKLQNAAAAIDRIGEESKVIPGCFVISIVITTICALMTLFWAY